MLLSFQRTVIIGILITFSLILEVHISIYLHFLTAGNDSHDLIFTLAHKKPPHF